MLQPFTIDDTTCKYVNGLTSGYLPTIYNNLPWIYDVNIYIFGRIYNPNATEMY
jgi:hypothetical protein